MVLTSHDTLGNTGKKTGFWLEEFAAPYYVFKDAGADITLASPNGGQPPLDPKSDEADSQTEATRHFKKDVSAQSALANTVKLSDGSAPTSWPQPRSPTRASSPTCSMRSSMPCSIPAATARCGISRKTGIRSA